MSGNEIGKSPFFRQSADAFVEYLSINSNLETIILSENMIRGPHAARIITAICGCRVLSQITLAHNFLGMK